MNGSGRARWAPLTGLAAVVLWFLGVLVAESGNNLDETSDAEDILSHFQAETTSILIGGVIFLFGVLLFMLFVTSLRSHIRGATTEDAAALAFGTGLATAVLLGASWVPQLSVAIALEDLAPQLSAQTAEAGWHLGTGFFVLAEFTCAAFLFSLAYMAMRGVGIPKWLAYIGILLGVVMLIPPIGWAALIFGFPVWVAIAGVVLSMRSSSTSPTEAPVVPG